MLLRAIPIACLLVVSGAHAQEPVRIGVAAPLSGTNAVLGRQVVAGARHVAGGADATLIEGDTQCSAEGGRAAADRFVVEKARVVIGFLCTESLEAALPVLKAAGIPAIDIGVRADRFTARRARTKDLVWRIAPPSGAEAAALARLVLARWRDGAFGLLDDGSIQGRGLADAVRDRLEEAGLRPSHLDTYRPAEEKQFGLARRLARTGITRFVIAGERADAAVIARDAAQTGVALELIGGEQLIDEPPDGAEVPVGTLSVAPRNRFPDILALDVPEAERLGYFGPAVAAAQIALEAARIAGRDGTTIAQALGAQAFATQLGTVRFGPDGDSDLDLFRTLRFEGRDFAPVAGG